MRVVLVVTLVAQRHRGTGAHAAVTDVRLVDQLDLLEQGLELTDAGFHLPLGVLGRVVVAVLLEVTQGAGRLDLLGDLDPATGGQVLQLGGQALEGALGELGRFGVVG